MPTPEIEPLNLPRYTCDSIDAVQTKIRDAASALEALRIDNEQLREQAHKHYNQSRNFKELVDTTLAENAKLQITRDFVQDVASGAVDAPRTELLMELANKISDTSMLEKMLHEIWSSIGKGGNAYVIKSRISKETKQYFDSKRKEVRLKENMLRLSAMNKLTADECIALGLNADQINSKVNKVEEEDEDEDED